MIQEQDLKQNLPVIADFKDFWEKGLYCLVKFKVTKKE
jgi:uncharacterized protein Usg